MVEKQLDTSGTVCPMPAFKTRKETMTLQPGDRLVVTGDFVPALENVARVAIQAGCVVVSKMIEGDRFTITIEKP